MKQGLYEVHYFLIPCQADLKVQEDMLRQDCKSKNLKVTGNYIDRSSGSNLERNELVKMLEDASESLGHC